MWGGGGGGGGGADFTCPIIEQILGIKCLHTSYNIYFLLGLNGNTYVDWMAIANVLPKAFPSTDFVFRYRGQENESTVWQGKNRIVNLLMLYKYTQI